MKIRPIPSRNNEDRAEILTNNWFEERNNKSNICQYFTLKRLRKKIRINEERAEFRIWWRKIKCERYWN